MRTSKTHAFTLIELLVVISIIAILASIAIPVFSKAQESSQQSRALQQIKGVFYGLKMFANDHNGSFPSKKDEDEGNGDNNTAELNDANEAFANLVPTYVQSETPFGIPSSRYCKTASGGTRGPDNDTSSRQKVLEAGENTFAYVTGLSDTSNAAYPVIADGFVKGSESNPVYSKTEGDYGAVWKGKKAIVVRCDGSTALETVNQNDLQVKRKSSGGNRNLFQVQQSDSDPWLVGCKVLNPRVGN